ncbi:hypothetical protein QGN32_23115 [Mycolicibacterium sp. ND9-15]|uniref:alpha-2-macroglobulin family protein n=1 Tax=Mycolicibacterium sp. ND9-15 TaxID=3042320 RepID=UPI002DD9B37D|nr:hypothetical protein [Mycolicibacterium sp. ND9-15]WSE56189.1 hypothetical protein QGN32_23115 [Mycolicibacterium sp. ND9-15]
MNTKLTFGYLYDFRNPPAWHRYRYTARATTPGTFTAGPPKAGEMYSPEVFGRGATDRVVIE